MTGHRLGRHALTKVVGMGSREQGLEETGGELPLGLGERFLIGPYVFFKASPDDDGGLHGCGVLIVNQEGSGTGQGDSPGFDGETRVSMAEG